MNNCLKETIVTQLFTAFFSKEVCNKYRVYVNKLLIWAFVMLIDFNKKYLRVLLFEIEALRSHNVPTKKTCKQKENHRIVIIIIN